MRVLVSRTDRIGDVILTLPLCGLLRTQLGAEVVVLGRGYTRPVLEASPYVDEFLDWDEVDGGTWRTQRDFLAAADVDVVVHVYPRPAIARAARAAGIPLRIGTSRRVYHWLTCNSRERLSRRHSAMHESQLNVRLARRLLGDAVPALHDMAHLTRLEPAESLPADVAHLIDPSRSQLVLHPRSGASAREWPLAHWRRLAAAHDSTRVQIVITGSRTESESLAGWVNTLPAGTVDLTGRLTLGQLIALYARVDGVVAASTGPLHVAAAVGTHALGLFSPTVPIHPGRWSPLGLRAEFMVPDAPCRACRRTGRSTARCVCLNAISVHAVHERVARWIGAVRDPGPAMAPMGASSLRGAF